MATIARIYRYPVKGLSAEPLQRVALAAGEGLPLDRKFALARAGTAFDPEDPKWLPKSRFLMLMRDERLAELRVAYDDRRGRLTVDDDGRREVDADIRSAAGLDALERFFEGLMGGGQGRPRLVSGPGHMFTDNPTKYASLINLATRRGPSSGRSLGPSTRCGSAPISMSRACPPGKSSTGWIGRSAPATSGSAQPSASTAAPRPTSILPAGPATSTSPSPYAGAMVTSIAACFCG
jgi:hypothetical protein